MSEPVWSRFNQQYVSTLGASVEFLTAADSPLGVRGWHVYWHTENGDEYTGCYDTLALAKKAAEDHPWPGVRRQRERARER